MVISYFLFFMRLIVPFYSLFFLGVLLPNVCEVVRYVIFSVFQAVLHDHERSRISSLTKDESDPRALAYIYQEDDTYSLFYIRMANLVTTQSRNGGTVKQRDINDI